MQVQIEYGKIIYQSQRKFYYKILNLTHHTGLRPLQVSFRSSPVETFFAIKQMKLLQD